MIQIKNAKELDGMRRANALSAAALKYGGQHIEAGMTTWELDKLIYDFIVKHGGTPNFKGLYGFPGTACISLNDTIIHGIPSHDIVIRPGDIVSIDTGAKIDINDDGSIFIASEDIEACRAARKTIENIVFEPEVGELYYGKVSNIRSDFGAWVELAPGKDGLIKIKDLEFKRTEKVEDVLKIGDMTWVKVMNVDDRGRIDLSRKDAMREKGLM